MPGERQNDSRDGQTGSREGEEGRQEGLIDQGASRERSVGAGTSGEPNRMNLQPLAGR